MTVGIDLNKDKLVCTFAALVAQWIEHLITDQKVGSSSLSGRTNFPMLLSVGFFRNRNVAFSVLRLTQLGKVSI